VKDALLARGRVNEFHKSQPEMKKSVEISRDATQNGRIPLEMKGV
jgi:hypothetical protein